MEEDVPIGRTGRFLLVEKAAPEMEVRLFLAIKQQNVDVLESYFWKVSDPDSEEYGKYLSVEQLSFLRPKTEHIEAVMKFLEENGVVDIEVSPHFELIKARMTVRQAERMFSTELAVFVHNEKSNVKLIRATSPYYLPQSVAAAVEFVEGLNRFPVVNSLTPMKASINTTTAWPTDCSGCAAPHITPAILKERYQISHTVARNTKSSMSVAEFEGQYYEPSDLSTFQKDCKLPNQPVAKVVGGNQNSAGIESTLDIEYILGVAVGVPAWFWYLDEYSLYDWILGVLKTSNAPLVHSVSYGDDEVQNGYQYMLRTNSEFQKAAVRGISVLFASGDQGVNGRTGPGSRFHPDFPGGSPYITAVGATEFQGENRNVEIGTNWSGGGFSDTFARPAYQDQAVNTYLSKAKLPPQSYWNRTGRAYPDIAAHGGNVIPYCILLSGQWQGVAGTSASCPVVAGVIALLNDVRLSAGKPALGFLNPFLYKTLASTPKAFYDVTQGNNKETGQYGFDAIAGWDPVTGVGTPIFSVLSGL